MGQEGDSEWGKRGIVVVNETTKEVSNKGKLVSDMG